VQTHLMTKMETSRGQGPYGSVAAPGSASGDIGADQERPSPPTTPL
jgi:hypothetical protein